MNDRIPSGIHEELMNWSRWCWLGAWPHPLPASQCGSLESQYRAPPEWDVDLEEMPQSNVRPNERNARVVQAVYESLPELGRLVLQAEYPGRAKYRNRVHAAVSIGLTRTAYMSVLSDAVNKVGEAFEICS